LENLGEIWAKSKSCILKNIRSFTGIHPLVTWLAIHLLRGLQSTCYVAYNIKALNLRI